MHVVIVESPAKAKTINKYLGSNYEVLASFGHIRDLPPKEGSVDPENDFSMLWEVDSKAVKRVSDIAKAVKSAEGVILATDPDREGEAIAWHVLEVLKDKQVLKGKKIERVVFNAITKSAISAAMQAPRQVDQGLVEAYLARRALDYLVGFNLSPILWRKLPGARSAGRVQSVALRLVCEREVEIETFIRQEYWSILASLRTLRGDSFFARLVGEDGKKISRLGINSAEEAGRLKALLDKAQFTVLNVESKPTKRHPPPPFTTSTLQQEASRKLGLAPGVTMRIAQQLYEGIDFKGEGGGLITYMRTDGVDMAPEAVQAVRKIIGQEYGEKYIPNTPRKYTAKAKNAQEAHEAIRPTDPTRLPKNLAAHFSSDQIKLYELIWNRTLASQMESAELERTRVDIAAVQGSHTLDLRANGQVIRFDGFLKLYQEGKDEEEEEEGGRLPPMSPSESLQSERIDSAQHFTEPPPRFTEAALVKRMEELGIGRPSTYASTLSVLRDREYVRLEKKRLFPEDKGRLVIAFLESFFKRYVEYDFTAALEEKLDVISNHEVGWTEVLKDFWQEFSAAISATKELRTAQVLDVLNDMLGPYIFPVPPDQGPEVDPRQCPACQEGKLSLKVSKFGAFIGCSRYPDCAFTRPLSPNLAEEKASLLAPAILNLGKDPESDLEVTLRQGRFGPYVQLGEGQKPKRASIPKDMQRETLTLEKACALLALPREVALHPTTHQPIFASIGRFGPYLQHEKTYVRLTSGEEVLEIGANKAIDLIVNKESHKTTPKAEKAALPERILGEHPQLGGIIRLKENKTRLTLYHGQMRAVLAAAKDPASVTLEEAVALLEAKGVPVVETAQEDASVASPSGRLLGAHPQEGGNVFVRSGRFGPYVTHNKVNASLPKSSSEEEITLEEAIGLLEKKKTLRSTSSDKAKKASSAAKKMPSKAVRGSSSKTT